MPIPATFTDAAHEEMVCCVMELIRARREDFLPTDPEWIIGKLRDLLRAGLAEREHTIARARAGDVLAHQALLLEFRELTDNHILPPASLNDYVGKPDLHPRRGKGPSWWTNYRRDFWIALLVDQTCETYGIARTRNPASSRKIHCGAAVVSKALTRSGHTITEKGVANVCGRCPIWDELWDKLGLSMIEHTKIIVARRLEPR